MHELCNVSRPALQPHELSQFVAEEEKLLARTAALVREAGDNTLYVDAAQGNDNNAGTIDAPLKTIAAALLQRTASPRTAPFAIVLRAGLYTPLATLNITRAHSNTRIVGYPGERVVVSGAVPLADLKWTPWRVNASSCANGMCIQNDSNDIYNVPSAPTTLNVTRTPDAETCAALCAKDARCLTFTWHDSVYPLEWKNTCWFRIDQHAWNPVKEGNHTSGASHVCFRRGYSNRKFSI